MDTTMIAKREKYREMKKHAHEKLEKFYEEKLEDDEECIRKHLAHALTHGSSAAAAEAIMLTMKWLWANCELAETE